MRAAPFPSLPDRLTLYVDAAATVKVYAILYHYTQSAATNLSIIYTASVRRAYSNSPTGLFVMLSSSDGHSADTISSLVVQWIVSVAYGLAVVCDLITALALIFVLRRSRTGVKRYACPFFARGTNILTLALRAGLTRSWMRS